MALADITRLIQIEPSLAQSTLNLTTELVRAESKILRLLSQTWWSQYQRQNPQTIGRLNSALLVKSEWEDIVCYYALAYSILPNSSAEDSLIANYHTLFEQHYRTRIEFGITYDEFQVSQQTIEPTAPSGILRMRK